MQKTLEELVEGKQAVECAKCKQMTREVDVPLDNKSVYRLKMLCLPCADEEERGCEIERMLKYGNG